MDYQNMTPEEKWETATLANKFFFYKIFFNARMYDTMGSEEEKSFFGYLCNGTAYSDFTRRLEKLMSQAR
ncbi:MAG: hypothetical protein K5930_00735, partial [Treponemataceae bacterium]|nr:hypothetical protein [Treponemataceae bacterium]